MTQTHRSAVIREVLIEATDIIPHGSEPFVGWSAVLADRIAAALERDDAEHSWTLCRLVPETAEMHAYFKPVHRSGS